MALPTVELKIEVVLPEKERGKDELSASGKGSPRAYQGNGTARHFHTEERLPAPHSYPGPQDCVEAAVCHVKDLENGQWVLGWEGGHEGGRLHSRGYGETGNQVGAGLEGLGTTKGSPPLWLLWSGPTLQKAELWEEVSQADVTCLAWPLSAAPLQDAGSGAGLGEGVAGEGQWGIPRPGP